MMGNSDKNDRSHLLQGVAEYYSARLAEHGETPQGVDWNGEVAQILRFTQLTKVLPEAGAYSLNDIGCGYGALVDFLKARGQDFVYAGNDVSADMVAAAGKRYVAEPNVRFSVGSEVAMTADYGIASGIFNVRHAHDDAAWLDYIHATLDMLNRTSRRGFAFNCLTSYSDPERTRDYLYYADPCALFDHCKRHYSRQVALLHDYGLYEFTMLVRKDA
jgi:SAM-dependent methyltransferase